MNEESLVRRTLVLTGKLVGVFTIWIALLSFVLVTVTDRMILALSSEPTDQGAALSTGTPKKDEGSRARSANPPANVNKPNG